MNKRILVGNVPVEATEDGLRELFASVGSVTNVVLPKDDRGRNRGFASIIMASSKDAISAKRRLSNAEFLGRKLSISLMQEAEPPPPKTDLFSFFRKFGRQ